MTSETSEEFKPLEMTHKSIFDRFLALDPPEISELSFTNLFMWRKKNRPVWREQDGCVLLIMRPGNGIPFGIQPFGPGDKEKALAALCGYIENMTPQVEIKRAGKGFVEKWADPDLYSCTFDRDNSDYVYTVRDLIDLAGKKYHRKKHQLNRFTKKYHFEYKEMDEEMVECFLDMQEEWCRMKECEDNQGLVSEDYAIRQALTHFEELDYRGGAIQIDSKLEAITLGEMLDSKTAVIHIEKANPEIPGLYVAMNHFFCRHAWSEVAYVNREQDLGIKGLRTAKESYYPHHMVKKYTLTPKVVWNKKNQPFSYERRL